MKDEGSTNVLDLFKLDGRVRLVTGGSKGLGREIALALAQAGADVIITSRNAAQCVEAAQAIGEATGRGATSIVADVSQPADVDRLFQEATREGKRVDILVNSAGLNIRKSAQDLSEADWDAVVNVNLKAPFLLVAPLRNRDALDGWGRIVHLGSIMSLVGMADRTPYASSKAGLLGLTRALAMEWATRGVTVNALCPGPFATDMNKPLLDDPKKYAEFVAKIPMGRWGELHEITGAALFLASRASSYMTGATLLVDGGWTAQ